MKYVALLRGIGPGDPRMRNDKLRSAFETLGLRDVKTVISSGNIIFSSDTADTASLEQLIEEGLFETLGFRSTAVIRSQESTAELIARRPFSNHEHTAKTYLLATFLKTPPKALPDFPATTPDEASIALGYDSRANAVFTVTDTTRVKTPDAMRWLEKQFGKGITSRTWKTMLRINEKF